jgi:exosome complex RNA-binding protein Rrp42 (RNase PH superfamily)
VGPYLVAMLVEEAANVWMVRIDIDFVGSDGVCADVTHVAEVIQNVEAIVTKTETVDIFENM